MSWNVYAYVIGTDNTGGGDFNVMRQQLQNETSFIYPWVSVTYDFRTSQIRKRWKRSATDAHTDQTFTLSSFTRVYRDIETMGTNQQQIQHLHFLTHFGQDRIWYQPNTGSSIADLRAAVNLTHFAAAFAPAAVVKIHGCQQDRGIKDLIEEFCGGSAGRAREVAILAVVRTRISQSYPFQLAGIIQREVWGAPLGTYAIYECTYLPASERGRRFCIEVGSSVHSFQRTIRFYEANYGQIFSRTARESVFDLTYHLKYKSPLAVQAVVTPSPCAATVPARPGGTATPTEEIAHCCGVPSAAEAFDAIALLGGAPSQASANLSVIGAPGAALADDLLPGDRLIRRRIGEGGAHVATLASSERFRREEVEARGFRAESKLPGWYTPVTENGHTETRIARRILDEFGRVPRDQALVRQRRLDRRDLGLFYEQVSPRTCCLLATSLGWMHDNLIDLSELGDHGGDESNGIIYTGKAGFIDLGHLRDLIDMTKWIYDQMVAAAPTPRSVETTHGRATFTSTPPRDIYRHVARAIAYQDSVGYEIWTYDGFWPGSHNSSFSPEDLPSNYLGTFVAERAIASHAGGTFESRATTEIRRVLTDLDAQPKRETRAAFARIRGRWVSGDVEDQTYLRRRNFFHTPWKTGHSSDAPTPAWVTAAIPHAAQTFFNYRHTASATFDAANFGPRIIRIRTDARTRYGARFDQPS